MNSELSRGLKFFASAPSPDYRNLIKMAILHFFRAIIRQFINCVYYCEYFLAASMAM